MGALPKGDALFCAWVRQGCTKGECGGTMKHEDKTGRMIDVIFDSHCDSISCALTEQVSLSQRAEGRQFDFAQAVGVTDFQVMAVFVEHALQETDSYPYFLQLQERLRAEVAQNEHVEMVTRAAQLHNWSKGRLGVFLALEGGEVIGTQLQRLEEMYALGLRAMSLTWNNTNALACGCGAGQDEGLSVLGREAVQQMNRLGVVVDIAHLAPKGIAEVLRLTQAPIMDSHTACAAICPHPRNLTDAQIKTLAEHGGVLGVTYVTQFLRTDETRASIDDVIEHIVHVAELVGTEHIGLGSDFDGVMRPLPGLTSVREVPLLADKLAKKGFHAEEIEGIMGGNFKRLFENVLN